MGLGPHTGRSAKFEERKWVPKGLPAQLSGIGRHLKGSPRRNVFSDVMSRAQHALCLPKGSTPTNTSSKNKSYRPVTKKETKDAQGEAAAATLNALQLLF